MTFLFFFLALCASASGQNNLWLVKELFSRNNRVENAMYLDTVTIVNVLSCVMCLISEQQFRSVSSHQRSSVSNSWYYRAFTFYL